MGDVIILLGSNIDPAKNIREGARKLALHLPIQSNSSVWITPAVGTSGPNFYNAAVLSSTNMDADTLKHSILRLIEEQMGRIRTDNKYAPRSMDLDAIILNDVVLESRLWDTAFILLPVAELYPGLQHPHSRKTLRMLAEEIKPTSGANQLVDFPLFETK